MKYFTQSKFKTIYYKKILFCLIHRWIEKLLSLILKIWVLRNNSLYTLTLLWFKKKLSSVPAIFIEEWSAGRKAEKEYFEGNWQSFWILIFCYAFTWSAHSPWLLAINPSNSIRLLYLFCCKTFLSLLTTCTQTNDSRIQLDMLSFLQKHN